MLIAGTTIRNQTIAINTNIEGPQLSIFLNFSIRSPLPSRSPLPNGLRHPVILTPTCRRKRAVATAAPLPDHIRPGLPSAISTHITGDARGTCRAEQEMGSIDRYIFGATFG